MTSGTTRSSNLLVEVSTRACCAICNDICGLLLQRNTLRAARANLDTAVENPGFSTLCTRETAPIKNGEYGIRLLKVEKFDLLAILEQCDTGTLLLSSCPDEMDRDARTAVTAAGGPPYRTVSGRNPQSTFPTVGKGRAG